MTPLSLSNIILEEATTSIQWPWFYFSSDLTPNSSILPKDSKYLLITLLAYPSFVRIRVSCHRTQMKWWITLLSLAVQAKTLWPHEDPELAHSRQSGTTSQHGNSIASGVYSTQRDGHKASTALQLCLKLLTENRELTVTLKPWFPTAAYISIQWGPYILTNEWGVMPHVSFLCLILYPPLGLLKVLVRWEEWW